jgi:hypothetical protein
MVNREREERDTAGPHPATVRGMDTVEDRDTAAWEEGAVERRIPPRDTAEDSSRSSSSPPTAAPVTADRGGVTVPPTRCSPPKGCPIR